MHYTTEQIAKAAYICGSSHYNSVVKSLGNQVAMWDDTNQAFKDRLNALVIEHHDKGSDVSPAMMHNAWRDKQAANGWVYGDKYNEFYKTDPDLVDYVQLPIEKQVYLTVFHAIVHGLRDKDQINFKLVHFSKLAHDVVSAYAHAHGEMLVPWGDLIEEKRNVRLPLTLGDMAVVSAEYVLDMQDYERRYRAWRLINVLYNDCGL